MLPEKNQLKPALRLVCPACGRVHDLAPGELAPGRGWRCACGWSLRVVGRHQAPAPLRPRGVPAV